MVASGEIASNFPQAQTTLQVLGIFSARKRCGQENIAYVIKGSAVSL